VPDGIMKMIEESGLELAGIVPEDDVVYDYDSAGRPTVELPDDNNAVKAAFNIFDNILS
jgi:CO dehydrogenase maturation factor